MWHYISEISQNNWVLKRRDLLNDDDPNKEKYRAHASECNIRDGDRGGARIFYASSYQALQYCCCDYDDATERTVELMFFA